MSTETIKVLLVQGSPDEASWVREMLSRSNGFRFEIDSVSAGNGAAAQLKEKKADVALIDLAVNGETGLNAISEVHAQDEHLPIILFTDAGQDEALKHQAIERGASDWLLKPSVSGELLVRALRYAVERRRAEEALRESHAEVEFLLSSITSILIGINSESHVTHWNQIAERALGAPAENVLERPIAECEIQWEYEKVAEGIKKCRENKRPIRINDVPFLRPDGQPGFLGFTMIPVQGGMKERIEILIFGADITERKKMEQMKDEFVSTVSHELRTPLTVIREGVSQVLEGILGPTTEDQKSFLSISLQSIDRLARIINDLLDMSKIEAAKMELKLDLIDVRTICRDIAASNSPFQLRAKEKGLQVKARLPEQPVRLYADRDKLIQVFTNLIGNSMKFTEKGHVEVSVEDKGEMVECRITDTGKGISKEDLPKVFGKFQQFGRSHGAGEKGTGLGLAISKGLVEMHRGKIWVESKPGEGASFVFTLPKLSSKDIFRHSISSGLQRAIERGLALSIVHFEVKNSEALMNEVGEKAFGELLETFEKAVKQSLRNQADQAVLGPESVLVVLQSTNKTDAESARKRIDQMYEKALEKAGTQKKLAFAPAIVTFPDDGRTEEELLNALLTH